MLPGAVPDAGVAESHDPPDAVAVKVAEPEVETTEITRLSGAGAASEAWNVKALGVSRKDRAVPTCVTVTVWPAIVIAPVRASCPVAGAALKATVPGPEPVPPAVTVSQGALDAAVHGQPGTVDIPT